MLSDPVASSAYTEEIGPVRAPRLFFMNSNIPMISETALQNAMDNNANVILEVLKLCWLNNIVSNLSMSKILITG